jgi:hypothetical protein
MEDDKIDVFEHAAWVVKLVTHTYLQFNTHNSHARNKPQKIQKFSTHTEYVHLHDDQLVTQETSKKGREAAAPSFIKEIQEVQGGKKRHTMVMQSSPKMPK